MAIIVSTTGNSEVEIATEKEANDLKNMLASHGINVNVKSKILV